MSIKLKLSAFYTFPKGLNYVKQIIYDISTIKLENIFKK